ncbi:hypothetical protein GCM10022258_42680 [Aquimarina gracilis]
MLSYCNRPGFDLGRLKQMKIMSKEEIEREEFEAIEGQEIYQQYHEDRICHNEF